MMIISDRRGYSIEVSVIVVPMECCSQRLRTYLKEVEMRIVVVFKFRVEHVLLH